MSKLAVKDDMIFIAIDGDGIGKLVGRAVLSNDVAELHNVSNRIDSAQDFILRWAHDHGGIKISGGGDEATIAIPKEVAHQLEELRNGIEKSFGYTISIGTGKNLAEAGTALLVAKLRGKDRIVRYSSKIEYDIKKAKRRVREKRASPDEYKLSEAYLKKSESLGMSHIDDGVDCPYCQDEIMNHDPSADGHATDCPYCQEMNEHNSADCPYCQKMNHDPNAADHAADCPYCADIAARASHNPSADGHPDDCPYCAESASSGQVEPTAGPDISLPTTTTSQNFAGQDLNTPDMPKPDPISDNPPGLAPPLDEQTNENKILESAMAPGGDQETAMQMRNAIVPPERTEGLGPSNSPNLSPASAPAINGNPSTAPDANIGEKEHQSVEEVVAQLDAEESLGGEKAIAQNMDDAALPVAGGDMDGSASKPGGFDQNAPGDMALGSNSIPNSDSGVDPSDAMDGDVGAVLQEGLDGNADGIKREQVVQMVASALVEFKACRDILENAKLQSPQLYTSSISMLKAMIEMGKLLGLEKQAEQAAGGVPPVIQSKDPSAAMDGAAPPSPKSNGAVGQSIGKLPTSATTSHVPRTTMLPGAVNDKGQKKIIDPVTGDVRWIDMKEGKVQSPTGVPIKPPQSQEEENGSQDPNRRG